MVSSAGNEQFYLNCGFDNVVGNVTEGAGNPFSGVDGGALLLRDRRGTRGSFMGGGESVIEEDVQSFGESESSSGTQDPW